ncbi:MAG TPA: exodeoxyribonuclease V subunit gamma, partial [Lysobacter sp.]|nr:exodeoxyribonuclease V subunit gamma [Lysobacter sp.]
RVMATQARVGTLHFYLPTPTKEYWGDLQSLGARLRAGADPFGDDARDNPLLRDWGAAGKDFMALLGGDEVVQPSGEIGAYVDPEEGGQRDSLLHRMQADLFHRRDEPSNKRSEVDPLDPSLQFHACHTRLRELQVLHDRLRALLEDKRFDPPLQPREIAVLAPDIDPYAPYLDAVFGGEGDAASGQAIPYALADASPLQDEPLAEVFLRLLALPVSRFGLGEILDLLASPPLAEAANLDARDFDRLHAWLQAAGARWGIDAAHRGRVGAPRDDAYTWQFALDRLLLGHASGDDGEIGGIASWPELEGGALAALDALLRLLRVLARHERLLGESPAPAQWRERLLALLEALLPKTPSNAGALRALERLRALIDDFAKQAGKAGFDAPVAPEVVRAHFAAALSEADTRAPLLTGGVSFARMVPMRLLPFRVICLLGMNDGDFPRRDPAAGLNRLVAELGSRDRRRGDRSTRDDDRYLFLQLFSAAQDAFYLSWLGADPRDGSTREPSALVSELLAAASAYHAKPDEAAKELVLRHPLQPFSPQAFGAGDPRFFSYRRQWNPAAGSLAGTRRVVPPWIGANETVAPLEPESELSLDALRRFLLDPAGQFLRQRLDIRLPEVEAAGEDIEPLQAPSRGLQRHALQRAVFDAWLEGRDETAMRSALRARGLLPSGAPGARALAQLVREVGPYAEAFARWRGDAESSSLPVEARIDGLRLHGRLIEVRAQGVARLRFGAPNGPSSIRNGLDWLLATAAGIETPFVEFHETERHGVGPHEREAISREQAIEALRGLLALRRDGLQRPLPFAPYSAWEFFAADGGERGLRNAAKKWRGSEHGWAEGDSDAIRLALRGRDPFADAAGAEEFARTAGIVFGAVTRGLPTPIDLGEVALPEDDAEDAA